MRPVDLLNGAARSGDDINAIPIVLEENPPAVGRVHRVIDYPGGQPISCTSPPEAATSNRPMRCRAKTIFVPSGTTKGSFRPSRCGAGFRPRRASPRCPRPHRVVEARIKNRRAAARADEGDLTAVGREGGLDVVALVASQRNIGARADLPEEDIEAAGAVRDVGDRLVVRSDCGFAVVAEVGRERSDGRSSKAAV